MDLSRNSKARDIEIDLACVAWARRQREREVRKALLQSKAMKQNDELQLILTNRQEERKSKKKTVVESELGKALVLADTDFARMKRIEARDCELHKQVRRYNAMNAL